MDPYQRWAALTTYRGYSNIAQGMNPKVPVAIELRDGVDIGALADLVEVPSIYKGLERRYCTGYVRIGDFDALTRHPGVERAEPGLPLEFLRKTGPCILKEGTNRVVASKAVIGVVDIGCAYLNARFCDSSGKKTRILTLWQQDCARERPGWEVPAGFGYGRETGRPQIDKLLGKTKGDPTLEAKQYKKDGYLLDQWSRLEPATHGTHVLATVAGLTDELRSPASAVPSRIRGKPRAPAADLIFVDVPRRPDDDTTGASSCVHVIDGLNYIVDRANGAELIVVNISLGAQAGPHDGSSIVEQAIDDLVDGLRKKGQTLVVVMAAGNAFDEPPCHVEGKIERRGTAEFLWRLLPGDPTDNFVEIWYDSLDGAEITVELIPPVGGSSGEIPCGQSAALSADGNVVASLLHSDHTATGAGPMALLAVGPTRTSECRNVPSPHGLWAVRIHNHRDSDLDGFHAWVERDDAPVGVPPRRNQSYLLNANVGKYTTGAGTLNNIATGRNTQVVAASDRVTGLVSRYSSARSNAGSLTSGGKRDRKCAVTVLAPGDESRAFGGLIAAGVLSGSTFRMGGTSVAAPVAARQIFESLKAWTVAERERLLDSGRMFKAVPSPPPTPGGTGPQSQLRPTAGDPPANDPAGALSMNL